MTLKPEEILAEYAEGLAAGTLTVADLIEKYQIEAGSELDVLLQLAETLDDILMTVEPSAQFVDELHQTLLKERETLLARLRHLSPSQVAAGIGGLTVAAGLLWLARRSALDILVRRNTVTPDTAEALAS